MYEVSKEGKSLECPRISVLWLGIVVRLSFLLPHSCVCVLIPTNLNFLISRIHFRREEEDVRLLHELLIDFLGTCCVCSLN